MALRGETEQQRQDRKKLEEYFRVTKWEQQQLEGTCATFLTSLYFWHGETMRKRLLKEPYKEWALQLNRCVRQQVSALVDDKKALERASADELVRTFFWRSSCPRLTFHCLRILRSS